MYYNVSIKVTFKDNTQNICYRSFCVLYLFINGRLMLTSTFHPVT